MIIDENKYKEFDLKEILKDLEKHAVARFKVNNEFYSLWKLNAIKFDLVHDNSEKIFKSKFFSSFNEAIESLKEEK